ncbi:MAG: type II toxin-antitoxin system Phd/YefM family antitoxin [Cyanobacteriota bacterium]|nr:type II toxin-antitoxin system Phd/YefM family antitoxin [Cyanobacteriota bacterium]
MHGLTSSRSHAVRAAQYPWPPFQSHEPEQITGKRGNAELISEEDWRAIEETLHLVSIPGMRESILEGMGTDVAEMSSNPGW